MLLALVTSLSCHASHRCTAHVQAGDRYDGEFNQGKEDGLGIFTWADNTTYEGHWQAGQKHGMGLYRPATEPDRKSLALRHDGVTAGMLPHHLAAASG